MCKRFCKVGRKKVLKSDHPTEVGRMPKNTAVIFKVKRTNQVLQSISGGFVYRHPRSRKVNLYVPQEGSLLSGGQTLHFGRIAGKSDG